MDSSSALTNLLPTKIVHNKKKLAPESLIKNSIIFSGGEWLFNLFFKTLVPCIFKHGFFSRKRYFGFFKISFTKTIEGMGIFLIHFATFWWQSANAFYMQVLKIKNLPE
jgi:hypothetical protein